MKTKLSYFKITEYPNIIGLGAFTALTVIQTVLFVLWLIDNLYVNGEFLYRPLAAIVIMALSIYGLTNIISEKVMKNKTAVRIPICVLLSVYSVTLPITVSVCFDAIILALCVSLEFILISFAILYFYDRHEIRLYELLGMFGVLCVLCYLNRPGFWVGEIICLFFLGIQLVRNIKTKRKNISDKSWRNTLLLFLILVIIMLMPQYFRFNNIDFTKYYRTTGEQLAARMIVPYLDMEYYGDNEYLLGVIKSDEYSTLNSYDRFNYLVNRYRKDGLDMDEIWNNFYKNTFHRYKKQIALRYVKDTVKNYAAPFLTEKEMNSQLTKTHHGFYYERFSRQNPVLSDKYMSFGLKGLFAVTLAIVIQIVGAVIYDAITGKMKLRLSDGKHRIIEAVILVTVTGLSWTAVQTLFAFEGMSYAVSIGSTLTWVVAASFIFMRPRRKLQNESEEKRISKIRE